MSSYSKKRGFVRTLVDNSFLLIAGAVVALVWANLNHQSGGHSYHDLVHFDVTSIWRPDATASHGFSLHFIINDILMALFFAIAAKEVWESLLPGGALNEPRKAATPLLATVGGVLGPALVYMAGSYMTGTTIELGNGWAVPCATDIAFSYLIARMIFGAGHPAIAFLLLLAIADDAAGLMILAIFYPQAPIVPQWLMLTVIAMCGAMLLRRSKVHTHWAYLLGPGVISWFSFYQANIHPASRVGADHPVAPTCPHRPGNFREKRTRSPRHAQRVRAFLEITGRMFLGAVRLGECGRRDE